ncbi:DUF748 domain-containing protein [Hydrogenimonas sp.]
MKRLLLWVVLPLILLYTIAGFWLLPSLGDRKLPPLLSETLGTPVTMGSISFNPFTMALTIPDIAILDGNGSDLLRLEAITLDLDPVDSLLTLTADIKALRLKKPQITVVMHRDGSFNFSPILEHLSRRKTPKKEPESESGEPPRIHLGQFAVEEARVRFRDERPATPVELEASDLNFGIEHLRTYPSPSGAMAFEIETERGAVIRAYSALSLTPLQLDGNFSIEGLPLAPFTPYLQQSTRLGVTNGSGALALDYRLFDRNGTLSARIDNGRLRLVDVDIADESTRPLSIGRFLVEGVSLRWPEQRLFVEGVSLERSQLLLSQDEKGDLSFRRWLREEPPKSKEKSAGKPESAPEARPWHIDVAAVTLSDLHTRFSAPLYRVDADHTHRIEEIAFDTNGSLRLVLRSLALERVTIADEKRRQTPVKAARIALKDGVLQLPGQRLDIEAVTLDGPRLSATLFKDGQTNLQRLFSAGASEPEKAAPAKGEEAAKVFRVTLKRFDLSDGSLRFEDRSGEKPIRLALEKITFDMERLAYPQKSAAPFHFRLATPAKGTLRSEGTLLIDPLKADGKLKLANVALSPYLPYLQRFANLEIPSGTLGLEAAVYYDGERQPKATIDYRLTLENLRIDHALKREKIASFRRIVAADAHLQLMPGNMKIETLRIEEPYARVHIAQDRSTNLDGIVKKAEKAPAKKSVSKSAERKEPFNVTITRLKIEKGSSDFSDLSLPLPFRTHIHDLEGEALGIGNLPGNEAKIALKGVVNRYGMAKIDASLITQNPLERSRFDIDFRNLDMTNLSPYTGKYIGYAIKDGRMWLKLSYLIDEGRLKSDNKIVLKRLELGEKIESNESINAPIHLALALLKDADGVIDLDIPVEGNVTDPQFRIGKVVWQAIGNMISGIVTAPFRFLGSILGIKGEELQYLAFEPGGGTIDPTEREKLDRLAEAFAKRPLLALKITGVYHPKADTEAIAEAKLQALLAKSLGDRKVETIKEEQTLPLLERLYRERAGTKALETLKKGYRERLRKSGKSEDTRGYIQTLRKALRERFTVSTAELVQLADQRARRVADYMAGRGVGPERLDIRKSVAVEELTETGLVPMKLDLSAKERN